MGAKLGIYKPLTTPIGLINLGGSDCQNDGDCTDGTATVGMLKIKVLPLLYADKSKVCCMLFQPTVAGTGTVLEIARAAIYAGAIGVNATPGFYNKYCAYDFPTTIKTVFDDKTVYKSYDDKTGLLIANPLYGSAQSKNYCDGNAKSLAFATLAVAAASISMY